jgi:hypothetical protein
MKLREIDDGDGVGVEGHADLPAGRVVDVNLLVRLVAVGAFLALARAR